MVRWGHRPATSVVLAILGRDNSQPGDGAARALPACSLHRETSARPSGCHAEMWRNEWPCDKVVFAPVRDWRVDDEREEETGRTPAIEVGIEQP